MPNGSRPFEGEELAEVLRQLAEISAIAFSLKHDLKSISEDDADIGAEPVPTETIQADLDRIQSMITILVMESLKAEPAEWYAANDGVQ